MSLDQMNLRCPGATLLNSARLDGWKYYINSDGYAGIQKSEGQHVMGGLWILKDEHWESLDSYEAVDLGFYTKAKIMVHDNLSRVNKECIVYLSTNRNYGIPSKDYQDGVIQGARDMGLSENYICYLESWRTGQPSSHPLK